MRATARLIALTARPIVTARATAFVFVFAMLLVVPAVPASPPPGPLQIAEILSIPDAAQGQREFIEVWNPTNGTVDLAGWTVRDAPTASGSFNEFTFSVGRLASGGRIVVWSNGTGDARGPSWSTSPSKTVWNDAGDAATLLDPQGVVADWVAYGNSAAVPPSGFEGQAKPAAPARGLSLALDNGAWAAGQPTPALAPGTAGAMASATVLNVAPQVRLGGVPATAKPGQSLAIELLVEDGNGASDIVDWKLSAGGATVAQGAGTPTSSVALVAPGFSGPWILALTATDAGGLSATATVTVQVRDGRLSVAVSGGALRFPDLKPGDLNVSATDWATVRNEGTDAVTPLLDVSPFTGTSGEIPVDGNLQVGIMPEGASAANATWTPYAGPLTTLPLLAPGTAFRLSLRLDAVPAPLAAGSYGTTFAVVAA